MGQAESVPGNPAIHATEKAPNLKASRRGFLSPAELPGDFLLLAEALKPTGVLVTPHSQEYEVTRTWQAWNYQSAGLPSGIVIATTATDVKSTVQYAAERRLDLCIAGSRTSSHCMKDNSLVLDLSRMNQCSVDVGRKMVTVQPGTRWGDVDLACREHSLATTGSMDPNSSVIGSALHGGHGWLERVFGLVADNVLSAEIVLADGTTVLSNKTINQDLFWGIRGGGGNFGIVVSMTLQLFDLPNRGKLYGFLVQHEVLPGNKSRQNLLERYFEHAVDAADPLMLCITLHGQGPVREVIHPFNTSLAVTMVEYT